MILIYRGKLQIENDFIDEFDNYFDSKETK